MFKLNYTFYRLGLRERHVYIYIDIAYIYKISTYREITLGSQSPPQYFARTGSFVELPS